MRTHPGDPVWLFIGPTAGPGVHHVPGTPLLGMVAAVESTWRARVIFVDDHGFPHSLTGVLLSRVAQPDLDYAMPREPGAAPSLEMKAHRTAADKVAALLRPKVAKRAVPRAKPKKAPVKKKAAAKRR